MSSLDDKWRSLKQGQSFFIASLRPEETAKKGMSAAIRVFGFSTRPRYRVGIYKGRLGVLFTLRSRQ